MGETDRARREIAAARTELSSYADELFRRASPQHLKQEARAKVQAKRSEVQARLRSQALTARDRIQHDRRTQVGLGSAGALGLFLLGRSFNRSRTQRRAFHADQEERLRAESYRAEAARQGALRRHDLMGPPPPFAGPAITSFEAAGLSRQLQREGGRRFGLGSLILAGVALAGLRAASKRPEARRLQERLTSQARGLTDTASQKVKQVASRVRSEHPAPESAGILSASEEAVLSG